VKSVLAWALVVLGFAGLGLALLLFLSEEVVETTLTRKFCGRAGGC
jgi:hypothetical protein